MLKSKQKAQAMLGPFVFTVVEMGRIELPSE